MKLLECKECNFKGKALQSHINIKHNMSVDEYRNKHGKHLKMQYVSEEQRLKRVEIALNGGTNRRKEYWINRGFTLEEAEEKISEVQRKNNSNRKYDPSEIILNVEYWIQKHEYSKQQAINKVSEIQSDRSRRSSKFSGKSHSVRSKKQISVSMSKHIKNAGAKEWVDHFGKFTGRSNKEIEVYNYIKNNICTEIQSNTEICGWVVDMVYKNKVIEFYGDFWHANPKKYNPHDTIKYPGKDNIKEANEIWDKDTRRINDIERGEYSILIIWEHDWEYSRNEVIDTIKNFLKDA